MHCSKLTPMSMSGKSSFHHSVGVTPSFTFDRSNETGAGAVTEVPFSGGRQSAFGFAGRSALRRRGCLLGARRLAGLLRLGGTGSLSGEAGLLDEAIGAQRLSNAPGLGDAA